jgi:hypothetical protein
VQDDSRFEAYPGSIRIADSIKARHRLNSMSVYRLKD